MAGAPDGRCSAQSRDLSAARRALHGVAELVLAGPQYRASGTIRLRITAAGIDTVVAPRLTLTATTLVTPAGIEPLNGSSGAALGAAAGVEPGAPLGLYTDHSDVALDERLELDPDAASGVLMALHRGEVALRGLVPDAEPVLWPEPFDVAITVDKVNFGVFAGDGYLPEPYAYVGPWTPREGTFWNAPFGAARPLVDLPGDALGAFFTEGHRLAGT